MILLKNREKQKIYFAALIINLAIALKFSIIGTGINFLLISTVLIILLLNINSLTKIIKNQNAFYILPFVLLLPILTSYSSFRFISYFYSILFLAIFQVILSILYSGNITSTFYLKILILIIKLFFYVALIQTVLFKYEIYFNQIWTPINSEAHRINSLATEPSYLGIYIVITFYSYLVVKSKENKLDNKKDGSKVDYIIWGYVLFTVIIANSGFGIVFLSILFLSTISFQKKYLQILLIIIVFLFFYFVNVSSLDRIEIFVKSIFSFDILELAYADHSASIRIAPILIIFREFNILDWSALFGRGINYSKELFASIIPGIVLEDWRGGGFFPSFIFDYGIIPTILFFTFLKRNVITKIFAFESLFLILVFLNASFNTQLFWYCIIIFTINKYLNLSLIPNTKLNVRKNINEE